jgi:hypothetical protein
MRPQQVVDRVWIQFGDEVVGTLGVFDLKDVTTVTEDGFPSRMTITVLSSSLFPSIMREEWIVFILSSRCRVGLFASGACGESMPTSSAISMQSESIASFRWNGGSYAMVVRPFNTAIIIPPMAAKLFRLLPGNAQSGVMDETAYH